MLIHQADEQHTVLARSDVLLLSGRRVANLVAYCLAYEFEDVLGSVTNSRRIDVIDWPGLEFSRRAYKLASLISRSPALARRIAPYPRTKVVLDSDFELFFPMFNSSYELYSLATIPNWRQRCHKAACFITEVWPDWLPDYLIRLLAEFDHIFIGCRNSVEEVARLTGRPCTYLPFAVDVLNFVPASVDKARPIGVCNIGRRSQVTHQALLEIAEAQPGFYYHYDTVASSGSDMRDRTFRVDSPHEHRRMLATTLKHSHCYIANRSYVNRPEFTAGHDEISARFYEGAAAGTVMIGEAPRSDEFARQFDWPDAVIHLPFDSPDIADFLADVNSDWRRIEGIRRRNVREAAIRHDWLNRIQVVFDFLGLAPTEKMRARARRLEQIAAETETTQC